MAINTKRNGKACRCGKAPYPDEIAAKLALAKIQRKSTELKVPARAYRCPHSRFWHLTSRKR